jgi:hypothetical protein
MVMIKFQVPESTMGLPVRKLKMIPHSPMVCSLI